MNITNEQIQLGIRDLRLEEGEYYSEVVEKDAIFLHHTAGSHRPDWVISGAWENDKTKAGLKLPVATAYVIGGISTTDRNGDFDGVIYRAFPDNMWAHHLGTTRANNSLLNKKSVAIEICNYGGLTKGKDGKFYTYVNKPVPVDMVVELPAAFRGYKYYHAYTNKQLSALRNLIVDICRRHTKIDPTKGMQSVIDTSTAFEINLSACGGGGGIWSHSSVLESKSDVYPDPRLIELIKSL